ncbi:oxidoreductase-like domain-containing protein 1 isoform X3 [Manis pentadactyla]|uniref:oxidoreductase-like domain-containing protein 1 isoform X3 n=1 Tax=Manis pentadactyla TaxID=143292 RepID=UPI00255C2D51|nr:oxidoreductase-like domain-containing protein 1 isoform X3 [Manis pentadactyla]
MLPRSLAGGGRAVAAAARGQRKTGEGVMPSRWSEGQRTPCWLEKGQWHGAYRLAPAPQSCPRSRIVLAGEPDVPPPHHLLECTTPARPCMQHFSWVTSSYQSIRSSLQMGNQVWRGPADCPAVTGARGFLEAVAFFTGTLPGSKSVKAAESWGRRRAPTQAQTAPGSPGRPCLAGAPQNLHTTCHLSSSRPQTVA